MGRNSLFITYMYVSISYSQYVIYIILPFIKIITDANDVLNMFKSDWDPVHVELPLLIVNQIVQTVNLCRTYLLV